VSALAGRFSPREAQILELIASGHTDKEIGAALGISRKTVESLLGRLYRKRHLRGRAHAVVAWLEADGTFQA
jgi:DNA-binding CsgD family transcriptional regulator